jgi:hypothetical protein
MSLGMTRIDPDRLGERCHCRPEITALIGVRPPA